jgi:hypothetical protein
VGDPRDRQLEIPLGSRQIEWIAHLRVQHRLRDLIDHRHIAIGAAEPSSIMHLQILDPHIA